MEPWPAARMCGIAAARAPHRRGEVDAQDRVPRGGRHGGDRPVGHAAPGRVVHEDGQASEPGGRGLDERGALGFGGEIGREEVRRSRRARDLGRDGIAPFPVAPGDDDGRALARERDRDRAPDPDVEPVTSASSPAIRTKRRYLGE